MSEQIYSKKDLEAFLLRSGYKSNGSDEEFLSDTFVCDDGRKEICHIDDGEKYRYARKIELTMNSVLVLGKENCSILYKDIKKVFTHDEESDVN